MQIGRLFEIVYILLNKRKTTAGELAERFEVSVRTIYRDIDALCAAGIPIYTSRGTGGGIFLQEDFVLNKSLLSAEEQNQILVALQSMSATGHLESNQLMSRLGGLFRKGDTDWIEVDFTSWGGGDEERETFRKLRDAVIEKRRLTFTYAGQTGTTSHRTVSPLKLLYKSKAWYLLAFCHQKQDQRMFKLTRMLRVEEPGPPFDPASLPPAKQVAYPSPDMPRGIPILLRFSPRAGYRIFDEFGRDEIERQPDGSYLVRVALPEDNWIYGTVLSYGADVEVLSPPQMRERICAILENIKKIYTT